MVVDDDSLLLERIRLNLELDGYDVRAFPSAVEALELLSREEPELVISDVMMPGMDGYGFKKEYVRRFPARITPFVFLTALSRSEEVVRGLDAGVDDYVTKPVSDEVLRAKVRSCLRRVRRYAEPAFRGDLARYSMLKVMRFCEQSGLNGTVDFRDGGIHATLTFRGGTVTLLGEELDETLERLYGLERGTFTIQPEAIQFGELREVALPPEEPPMAETSAHPAGRLSAVAAGGKSLQLQTEFAAPNLEIRTVVTSEGRILSKYVEQVPMGLGRDALQRMIDEQHAEVETKVEGKMAGLAQRKGGPQESAQESAQEIDQENAQERSEHLFWEGFKEFRKGRYDQALSTWLEAQALDPGNKVLGANLDIVRGKLEAIRKKTSGRM